MGTKDIVYFIEAQNDAKGGLESMCEVLDRVEERGIEKGIQQGIEQGIEKGIKSLVETLLELGENHEFIINKIMEKFEITEEQARKYLF